MYSNPWAVRNIIKKMVYTLNYQFKSDDHRFHFNTNYTRHQWYQ
jgi:hypothetical protein